MIKKISSHNNSNSSSTRNNGMQNNQTARNTNLNSDPRYQQGIKYGNNPVSVTNPNGSTQTSEQKKKNKSCVIL